MKKSSLFIIGDEVVFLEPVDEGGEVSVCGLLVNLVFVHDLRSDCRGVLALRQLLPDKVTGIIEGVILSSRQVEDDHFLVNISPGNIFA